MVTVRSLLKSAVLDRMPGFVRRARPIGNRIALTFDDGPDELTDQYLDVLDALGIPATFFLCGKRIDAQPMMVREYLRRGHQIANHGYDHTRFTVLSRRALLDQLARTEAALGAQLTGRPWIRPPHGALDPSSMLTLLGAGFTVAMWSVDSHDHEDHDVDAIVARCRPDRVQAGDVILLHEGQPWTLAALPKIVEGLRSAGLTCVTMCDLFAA